MMMKPALLLAMAFALAACQPPPKPAAEPAGPAPEQSAAPAATGLELLIEENGASLHTWRNRDQPSFTMTCVKDSATISASAGLDQFPKDIKAERGALVASGASFADDVRMDEGAAGLAVLTVKMTPELVKAVADSTTVRLSLGDSFAETAVDETDVFERFAAKCAALANVKIAP